MQVRKRVICRVLSAVGIACAFLLSSAPASAQVLPQESNKATVLPVIDFQRQALIFSVPVVGTPFRLNYRSDATGTKWRWNVSHAYDPVGGILSLGDGRPRAASSLFGQSATAPSWLSVGEMVIAAQDGNELYIFNQRGDHLHTLNALTGALVYRFDYNTAGGLIAIEDGYGNSTRIERDAAGFMKAVVAPHGQRTTFSNNARGYPTSIINTLGESMSFDYSPDGQLAVFTDPKKNVYRFTTNEAGRLTKLEGPAGELVKLAQTLTEKDAKLSWTTAMDRASVSVVERTPEADTSVVSTGLADAKTQSRSAERNTNITYSDGRTLNRVQQPDPRWGLQSPVLKTLSVAAPSGLTSNVSMNRTVTLADSADPLSLKTLTDTVSINGHSYTETFDAKNRQITRLTPAGRRAITTLDEHGRVSKVEVPGLLPITLNYDGQGRLITFSQGTGAEARVTGVVYNANGWVASVTDAQKRTDRFEYDAAGQIKKRIMPDGSEISLTYDAAGQLASVTPPGRPSHSLTYTSLGVLSAYLPPHIDQNAGNSAGKRNLWNSIKSFLSNVWKTIKFYFRKIFRGDKAASPSAGNLAPGDRAYIYNNDGQLNKIVQPDGSTAEFRYDNSGRLTAVNGAGSESRLNHEPKNAKVASIRSSDGSTLSPTYDGSLLRRLEWAGPVAGIVGFTYDNDLRVSSTAVDGEPPVTLEYDPDGLLTRAGNLKLIRNGPTGLLTKAVLGNVATLQEYNGFGEPTRSTATFKNKEILTDRYERDALGRIVRKAETIDGKSAAYTYAYDLAGRLIDVTENRAVKAHYEYDSNGNRITYTGPSGTVKASYDAQDRVNRYGSATYSHTAHGE